MKEIVSRGEIGESPMFTISKLVDTGSQVNLVLAETLQLLVFRLCGEQGNDVYPKRTFGSKVKGDGDDYTARFSLCLLISLLEAAFSKKLR